MMLRATMFWETQALDRKAHLFWEIPAIDAKVCDLMNSISNSGDAIRKLVRTGDTKDAKTFSVKKRARANTKLELSFVNSMFMMYKLRKRIAKAKAECTAYDNIRLYSHNFGDFVF